MAELSLAEIRRLILRILCGECPRLLRGFWGTPASLMLNQTSSADVDIEKDIKTGQILRGAIYNFASESSIDAG
jgi:hypothetical protein